MNIIQTIDNIEEFHQKFMPVNKGLVILFEVEPGFNIEHKFTNSEFSTFSDVKLFLYIQKSSTENTILRKLTPFRPPSILVYRDNTFFHVMQYPNQEEHFLEAVETIRRIPSTEANFSKLGGLENPVQFQSIEAYRANITQGLLSHEASPTNDQQFAV